MIEEKYVSFEIAKLLKEKGFKEITQAYINLDEEVYMWPYGQGVYELTDTQFPYPTQQMVMQWLRKVFNFHVDVMIDLRGWTCDVIKFTKIKNNYITSFIHSTNYFETYEEACEAGIKDCLEKLI